MVADGAGRREVKIELDSFSPDLLFFGSLFRFVSLLYLRISVFAFFILSYHFRSTVE